MTETVLLKGKIKKIDRFENETLEDLCERLYKGETDKSLGYYVSYVEALQYSGDILDSEYVIVKDEVYRVISQEDYTVDDLFEVIETSPGNFDYTLRYYNGGCSFSEALEYAFKKFKNKE